MADDKNVDTCSQVGTDCLFLAEPEQPGDLSKCPACGGPADNGHDRCVPPAAYLCTKCDSQPEAHCDANSHDMASSLGDEAQVAVNDECNKKAPVFVTNQARNPVEPEQPATCPGCGLAVCGCEAMRNAANACIKDMMNAMDTLAKDQRPPGDEAQDVDTTQYVPLLQALHDAIDKPKGVVPDSAAPFYRADMYNTGVAPRRDSDAGSDRLLAAAFDLASAARRVRSKFGAADNGNPLDWTEWRDVDDACNTIDRIAANAEAETSARSEGRMNERIDDSSPATCSAFHRWWQDEGIAKTIDIDDDAIVRRIRSLCKVAWSNGEYKAREADMPNTELYGNSEGRRGDDSNC